VKIEDSFKILVLHHDHAQDYRIGWSTDPANVDGRIMCYPQGYVWTYGYSDVARSWSGPSPVSKSEKKYKELHGNRGGV